MDSLKEHGFFKTFQALLILALCLSLPVAIVQFDNIIVAVAELIRALDGR